jgi:hypothetical protein
METSRSSFLLSHFGHLARCRPSTTLSNRLPHPRQTYSKIGIIVLPLEIKRSGNPGGTPQISMHDPQLRLQIHVQKQTKVLQWFNGNLS